MTLLKLEKPYNYYIMKIKIKIILIMLVVIVGIILAIAMCDIAQTMKIRIETQILNLSQPDYPAVQVR